MKEVTVVFTSCGRWNLFEQTIASFVNTNTYPIRKYIIIDNSTNQNAAIIIQNLIKTINIDASIIVNTVNIGQVSSIDKAYTYVDTDYIFHCEDDWCFSGSNYIEQSIDVLDNVPKIVNVNLRVRFDGEKGGDSPIEPLQQTTNGTKYHLYQLNYLNMWHGFSWNPGLRKLIDYNIIGKSYKNIGQEQHIGQFYKELGYRAACLEGQYAKHIGTNSSTPLSNQ
jgi:GT2 family glycosyltransferase